MRPSSYIVISNRPVIIVPIGEGRKAVVTDFGIAVRSSIENTSITESGSFMGTPAYMAPEQLLKGVLSPATDVYALGLVVFEMLTGQRLFKGETPLEIVSKRLSSVEPFRPGDHPEIPTAWEPAILGSLQREPTKRLQTPYQFVGLLR